ncbi:MAG: MFS transporter [Spirochaetia bacterium]|jgi:MFS family permease
MAGGARGNATSATYVTGYREGGGSGGRGILALSLIGFFGIFSTTMSKSPVLPLFVKSLSGSDTVIGLVAAISPIAGILFSFPVGMLADRLGKKKLLLAAAVVFLVAPLLYLLITNPFWLIPLRFFHGIATAILGPVAAAFIVSSYPKSKGEKLGLYSSATLIGRTLAPLLGGAIISLFASYHAVYLAAFLLCVPLAVLTLLLKDDAVGAAAPGASVGTGSVTKVTWADFRGSLAAFGRNGKLLSTSLVEMATYFAYGCLETYLPIFLSRQGVPVYQIGLIFSLQILSIALTKPLFGRLADTIDRRIQIMAGIVFLAACTAAIPLSSSTIVTAAIGILFGLGLSVSTVATSTYVAEVAGKENLGASLGALSSIMDIGHSSGPFVAGVIITATTIFGGFLSAAVVCVLAAALFALLAFRKTREP